MNILKGLPTPTNPTLVYELNKSLMDLSNRHVLGIDALISS